MTSRRRYARQPGLPPIKRRDPMPPFARRCPSGEYEVMHDGVRLVGGLDSFDEAEEWIKDNPQ